MKNDADHDFAHLLAFALKHAARQPARRRARLYRGLAAACGDEAEGRRLRELAAALIRVDDLCRQFKFSIIQFTEKRRRPARPDEPSR